MDCHNYKPCKGHNGGIMLSHCEECTFRFRIGEKVRKAEGYEFAGEIVARFFNKKGEIRYVVECNLEGAKGWLMIFNENQLKF